MQFDSPKSPATPLLLRQRRSRLHASKQAPKVLGRSTVTVPEYLEHRLQIYAKSPTEDITLQEFEDYAVDRLRVLKAVEMVWNRKQSFANRSEYYDKMLEVIKKENVQQMNNLLRSYSPTSDTSEDQRWDHISHFILRLAFCRNENLRKWFLNTELELFHLRWKLETRESISEFIQCKDLHFDVLSDAEKTPEFCAKLRNSAPTLTDAMVSAFDYYIVDFRDALDLVRRRHVYIAAGKAYIPQDELVVLVSNAFRITVSKGLARLAREVPNLEEDERLLPLLNSLHTRYLGKDYGKTKAPEQGEPITIGALGELCIQSFPPCMSQLHSRLTLDHHLKHWGRMQYGLFLKGIGLDMDQAMQFWRDEFIKAPGVDSEKFEKNYAYNVRHLYGKEGKRADYTPYSCIKIIMQNHPAAGDFHGCPFRHSDASILQQQLSALKIDSTQQEEILDLVRGSHYQLACGRYFDAVHGADTQTAINHPNQYFDESRTLRLKRSEGEKVVTSSNAPTASGSGGAVISGSQPKPMETPAEEGNEHSAGTAQDNGEVSSMVTE